MMRSARTDCYCCVSQLVDDHVRRESRCLIVHNGFVVVEVCPSLEGGRGDEPGTEKEKRRETLIVKSLTQRIKRGAHCDNN